MIQQDQLAHIRVHLDEVPFRVLCYCNSIASSHNLKHQTKSTGVFYLLGFFLQVNCDGVRLRVKMSILSVSVLMLGNNQDIKFQLKSPGVQSSDIGPKSSMLPMAGSPLTSHRLVLVSMA